MKQVWYFSAAGHSLAVARFFAHALNVPLQEIDSKAAACCHTAVVVFPVYCQNLPEPVKVFLTRMKAKNILLIATYGRMGYGNVLWEGAGLVKGQIIGAAYVPMGHTYRQEGTEVELEGLRPLLDRVSDPQPVAIPKLKKWWLADLFPDLRGKLSVKLWKNQNCTHCGLCGTRCPMGTMKNGVPGKNCIRCLRCIYECPQKALSFVCHPVLRCYLRKPRQQELVVYR